MIRYTVLWDAEVETQFTNAWVSGDGPVRAALTEIANWIDQNLTESPDQKGQLRNDLDIRVLAVPLRTRDRRPVDLPSTPFISTLSFMSRPVAALPSVYHNGDRNQRNCATRIVMPSPIRSTPNASRSATSTMALFLISQSFH
jgi:hypothetical protein